jgi:peptidoglycan/xylan/chitin deacetylase (PgdA/CDA1 family)
MRWLARHRQVVSLEAYVAQMGDSEFNIHKVVAITFDDGFRQALDCIYPVILETGNPVTIFTSTSHLNHGELLWFNYLKTLCYESHYAFVTIDHTCLKLGTFKQRRNAWYFLREKAIMSGDPIGFSNKLKEVYALDPKIIKYYGGLTDKQIKTACRSDLIEFGCHTKNHPLLNQLTPHEQQDEIAGSKIILSKLTGKPVRYFAYPGGKYNKVSVELVIKAGYEAAFATISQHIANKKYEIDRIGIYSQSMIKFQIKLMGVVDLVRRLGIKVG